MNDTLAAFARLLKIMDELREQCPWDRSQTIESLRYLTLEETYELSGAILENNLDDIRNELGDLLLHIVFYSRIGKEKGAFDIKEVIEGINQKLIKRHPHIYGDVVVSNAEQVKSNWEKIKLHEGNRTVLGGVPASLPALVKAYRIQDKARGVGFDWEESNQVWQKVLEELNELNEAVSLGDSKKKQEELGDLLFALVNFARFIDVNPEDALEGSNRKFIRRFNYLEDKARATGKMLKDMSLTEMEQFWNEAKNAE